MAEAVRKANTGLASNLCLYDADGNPVAMVAGAAGGGAAQLQVRNVSNVWTDVGYSAGNQLVPMVVKDATGNDMELHKTGDAFNINDHFTALHFMTSLGTYTGIVLEQGNNDGEAGTDWIIPVEPYTMVYDSVTNSWGRLRGDTANGVWVNVKSSVTGSTSATIINIPTVTAAPGFTINGIATSVTVSNANPITVNVTSANTLTTNASIINAPNISTIINPLPLRTSATATYSQAVSLGNYAFKTTVWKADALTTAATATAFMLSACSYTVPANTVFYLQHVVVSALYTSTTWTSIAPNYGTALLESPVGTAIWYEQVYAADKAKIPLSEPIPFGPSVGLRVGVAPYTTVSTRWLCTLIGYTRTY